MKEEMEFVLQRMKRLQARAALPGTDLGQIEYGVSFSAESPAQTTLGHW